MEKTEYEQLRIDELKSNLRRKGAKVSGRKGELIERLRAYDENGNFNNLEVEPYESFQLAIPKLDQYRDINKNTKLPNFTEQHMRFFMQRTELKSMDDGVALYESKFLCFVRACSMQDEFYIRGQCKAEMRKSVRYYCDILQSSDGHISVTHCECTAGMGPNGSCKHIIAILLGLKDFTAAKEIKTEETCTEVLQTHHRPSKKFKGSPMKCINLPQRHNKTFEFTHSKSTCVFDPRPPKKKESPPYLDHIRNSSINFQSTALRKMPIMQLFLPANPYAIAWDHDYLALSPEKKFLDELKITKISSEEVQEIERATRQQSLSAVWFKKDVIELHHRSSEEYVRRQKELIFPPLQML